MRSVQMQIGILIPRLNNQGTRPQNSLVWDPRNGESDRSCTVYANEQHQYVFRLRQYGHAT